LEILNVYGTAWLTSAGAWMSPDTPSTSADRFGAFVTPPSVGPSAAARRTKPGWQVQISQRMHMQVHTADHRLSVRQADLPMLQSTKDDRMQEPRLRVRRRIPLRTREGSLPADCGEHRLGRRRNTQVGGADREVLDCGWATAL